MSSANADAVTGEFMPKGPAQSEPLLTGGHQPGKLVGNDAKPEFHLQTLPAGTAPPEHTFKPGNADAPGIGSENAGEVPSAADTITGSTSADVHTGLGHPGSGQTASELRGSNVDKKGGLEGRGATVTGSDVVDSRDPAHADQRGLSHENAGPKQELGGAPAQELTQTNEKA